MLGLELHVEPGCNSLARPSRSEDIGAGGGFHLSHRLDV